jgi:hypothetical protein
MPDVGIGATGLLANPFIGEPSAEACTNYDFGRKSFRRDLKKSADRFVHGSARPLSRFEVAV